MKKVILSMCVAALAMSCAKEDQTVDGGKKPIGFKSFVERPTKAEANDSRALTQDFGVFGYWSRPGDESTDILKPDFMFKQQVVYTEGSGFSYTPVKFWPQGDINFYAYTPYDAFTFTAPVDENTVGYPEFDYTIGDVIADQKDLMVAAEEDADNATSDNVNFMFDHIFTRVSFAGRTGGNYKPYGVTVTITSVKLENVYNKGHFSFRNYAQPDGDKGLWWTVDTGEDKVSYQPALYEQDGVELKHVYQYTDNQGQAQTADYMYIIDDNQYMLLMPQEFGSTDSPKVTVNYTVSYDSGTSEDMTKEFDLYEITTDANKWLPGRDVTYAIKIFLNTVTFTAEVNDWDWTAPRLYIRTTEDEE